jgi:hypothetical protein
MPKVALDFRGYDTVTFKLIKIEILYYFETHILISVMFLSEQKRNEHSFCVIWSRFYKPRLWYDIQWHSIHISLLANRLTSLRKSRERKITVTKQRRRHNTCTGIVVFLSSWNTDSFLNS